MKTGTYVEYIRSTMLRKVCVLKLHPRQGRPVDKVGHLY